MTASPLSERSTAAPCAPHVTGDTQGLKRIGPSERDVPGSECLIACQEGVGEAKVRPQLLGGGSLSRLFGSTSLNRMVTTRRDSPVGAAADWMRVPHSGQNLAPDSVPHAGQVTMPGSVGAAVYGSRYLGTVS